MQEGCYDYSDEKGCCLSCPKGYPGCLCYECKCKKCYWYGTDGDVGWCDMIEKKKKENKLLWRTHYRFLELKRRELVRLLEAKNEDILKTKAGKTDIINEYTCQNCLARFYSREDKKIKISSVPRCDICLGRISLGHDKIIELENQAKKEVMKDARFSNR